MDLAGLVFSKRIGMLRLKDFRCWLVSRTALPAPHPSSCAHTRARTRAAAPACLHGASPDGSLRHANARQAITDTFITYRKIPIPFIAALPAFTSRKSALQHTSTQLGQSRWRASPGASPRSLSLLNFRKYAFFYLSPHQLPGVMVATAAGQRFSIS